MRSMSISGSCWCSFILTVSVRIMCRLNTRSWTLNFKSTTQYFSKLLSLLAAPDRIFYKWHYIPALGMACHAAPHPLRHKSGLSWVSDEDAPRWSFGRFPPVMTGTWWPASLLEQSSGPREELGQIVIHIPQTSWTCTVDTGHLPGCDKNIQILIALQCKNSVGTYISNLKVLPHEQV